MTTTRRNVGELGKRVRFMFAAAEAWHRVLEWFGDAGRHHHGRKRGHDGDR